MLVHAKDVNDPSRKKDFAKSNKEVFTAYFTFDYLLDDFLPNRKKYINKKQM